MSGWWNLNAKSEGNKSGKIKNKAAPLNRKLTYTFIILLAFFFYYFYVDYI